ncbi:MAG: ATP-binding cassette domain-containing protein, partial [Myxococcota bacterium]
AKARVEEAHRLTETLNTRQSTRQQSERQTQMQWDDTGRKTKELIVASALSKTLGEKPLFADLSFLLAPKMRLGILGQNGSGKTTLLRILNRELQPDQGSIKFAENLRIFRFEQDRASLDPNQTLRDALSNENDQVIYQGKPLHVASWARRFLFRDEQLNTKLHLLSGGEQARVQIARLMLQPADVLLIDEPTNDLDLQTLQILEQSLLEFEGALVLITHDRALLEHVSQSILMLAPHGEHRFFADLHQWEQFRKARKRLDSKPHKVNAPKTKSSAPKVKMSYHEKKELETMEAHILEAEAELEHWEQTCQDPDVAKDPQALQQAFDKAEALKTQIETMYQRWSELEAKQKGLD